MRKYRAVVGDVEGVGEKRGYRDVWPPVCGWWLALFSGAGRWVRGRSVRCRGLDSTFVSSFISNNGPGTYRLPPNNKDGCVPTLGPAPVLLLWRGVNGESGLHRIDFGSSYLFNCPRIFNRSVGIPDFDNSSPNQDMLWCARSRLGHVLD